jgi:hypothetical protein
MDRTDRAGVLKGLPRLLSSEAHGDSPETAVGCLTVRQARDGPKGRAVLVKFGR